MAAERTTDVWRAVMTAALVAWATGGCGESEETPSESVGGAGAGGGLGAGGEGGIGGAGAGGADPAPEIFVGAGDIAWCEPPGVGPGEETALLLDDIPGTVFTLGDNSNGNGTLAEYTDCFGPSWGRHIDRMFPAAGNHDYTEALPEGQDYHTYFGAVAGEPGKGWYSYDVGSWHVIVLNSNCEYAGCYAGGEQDSWLVADLAAHPAECTIAITHHPYFAPRYPDGSTYTRPFFNALYAAGVDLLLSGHYHWYERYAPQDADGQLDPVAGVRQFIVGTGGSYRMTNQDGWPPNSEAHFDDAFGVLELTLHDGGYDWRFVPEAGMEARVDSGSDVCH